MPNADQERRERARLAELLRMGGQPDAALLLDETLARLTRRQRDVVVPWLQGYTHQEIADMLGVCRTAVTQRLLRARKRMRGET